ncbi:unnamed protein product, partial [Rotaria socialis]
NLIKNGDKQFFHFINGGAGVGKSTLIKAVYQSILRFYNSLPGSNPETNRAALCAPTGKAAALIDGMTLHSFLSLPVNQLDNPLWSMFELFELTEIMRQKDDKSFAIALSNIAKGTMTLEDINLLKSRIVSTENLEMIEDPIMIFRSNAEVDAYNTKVLASLNIEGATANAYDFCVGDGLASIKEKVPSNVKNLKTAETYGLPLKIDLKVGAKYMMTVNSDTEDGLVNGACGKLVMIDYGK